MSSLVMVMLFMMDKEKNFIKEVFIIVLKVIKHTMVNDHEEDLVYFAVVLEQ